MSLDTIRRVLEWADVDHPNAPEDAREQQATAMATIAALITENNALRRNNERLVRENAVLLTRASEAESAARTAQTMAQHWRTEAKGGDDDATQEDAP